MLTRSFLMNSTLPTELHPLMLWNMSHRAIHPLLMTSFSTSLIFSPHLPSCFSPWTFIIWLLGCHTLVWPQELELLSKDKVTVRSFQRKAIWSDVSCLHWCGGLHGSGIWDFLANVRLSKAVTSGARALLLNHSLSGSWHSAQVWAPAGGTLSTGFHADWEQGQVALTTPFYVTLWHSTPSCPASLLLQWTPSPVCFLSSEISRWKANNIPPL